MGIKQIFMSPVLIQCFGPLALLCHFQILWSLNLPVLQSSPLVPWSLGPLAFGPLVLWSFGPLVPWSSGPLVLPYFGGSAVN
jgi:hypothetical protein